MAESRTGPSRQQFGSQEGFPPIHEDMMDGRVPQMWQHPQNQGQLPPLNQEVQIMPPSTVPVVRQSSTREQTLLKKPMMICGIIQISCAIGALGFAIGLSFELGKMNRVLITSVWSVLILILAGSFGIQASRSKKRWQIITCLILSIISAFVACIGLIVVCNDSSKFNNEDELTHLFDKHDHPRPEPGNRPPPRPEDRGRKSKDQEDWAYYDDYDHGHEQYDGTLAALCICEVFLFFIGMVAAIVQAGLSCAGVCKCCKPAPKPETQIIYVPMPIQTSGGGLVLPNQRDLEAAAMQNAGQYDPRLQFQQNEFLHFPKVPTEAPPPYVQ